MRSQTRPPVGEEGEEVGGADTSALSVTEEIGDLAASGAEEVSGARLVVVPICIECQSTATLVRESPNSGSDR